VRGQQRQNGTRLVAPALVPQFDGHGDALPLFQQPREVVERGLPYLKLAGTARGGPELSGGGEWFDRRGKGLASATVAVGTLGARAVPAASSGAASRYIAGG